MKNFAAYLEETPAKQFVAPAELRKRQAAADMAENLMLTPVAEDDEEITAEVEYPTANNETVEEESTVEIKPAPKTADLREAEEQTWAKLLAESLTTICREQAEHQQELADILAEHRLQQAETAEMLSNVADVLQKLKHEQRLLAEHVAASDARLSQSIDNTAKTLDQLANRLNEMKLSTTTQLTPTPAPAPQLRKTKTVNRDVNGLILSVTEEISSGDNNT